VGLHASLPPGRRARAVAGSTGIPAVRDPLAAKLAPSLVGIGFDMPYSVAGITERNYYGTGLIVDAARGLVVVDRNTVPVSLGDVRLTFRRHARSAGQGGVRAPAAQPRDRSFDPTLIGTTPMRSAKLTPRAGVGERLGHRLGRDGDQVARDAGRRRSTRSLPLSRTMQFRERTSSRAAAQRLPADFDGVLVRQAARCAACGRASRWKAGAKRAAGTAAFPSTGGGHGRARARGPSDAFARGWSFSRSRWPSARRLGLSDDWLKRSKQPTPGTPGAHRRAARRRIAGAKLLQQGDLLLAIDGRSSRSFRDVERAVADQPTVEVTVWRGAASARIEVPTVGADRADVERVVQWAGATLHAPHRAMLAQRGMAPLGVSTSATSPTARRRRARRIVGCSPAAASSEVDGQPTPDAYSPGRGRSS
jgi:hypothetical protein